MMAEDTRSEPTAIPPAGALSAGALQPGVTLGKYIIERRLGRGGMGVVFLAYDATLERRLAIKVLGSPMEDESSRALLMREARSASALNHPNICTIYEVGEENGRAFIAMEYIDGRPLRDVVEAGPLQVEDALRYGIEAADALAHAHDRGVVHHDLKAANAIVSTSGRLKVVDFGLARRTNTDVTSFAETDAGMAMGTPYAMAPEQVRGLATDVRTDIWALGVLLFEMLAGARPFGGRTTDELFASILRDPTKPLSPQTHPLLLEIVHTCLAKEAGHRYQRAADVRLVLEAVASELRGSTKSLKQAVAAGMPLPPPPMLETRPGAIAFVGRESELTQLEQVWTSATSGQRQLLLLAGEPGIGKTRLAVEFARGRADRAATVLAGRCDEEALVPYQPFVEALHWYVRVCPESELRAQLAAVGGGAELGPFISDLLRRVPDLPAPPAMHPEGQRYRLFETVSALLANASATRPILLVLDDLHWADKPTLLLLRHLVRSPDAASLCILGTYRESELARTHPLAEMLADLRREEAVTRLPLRGLDETQVRGLVSAFVGSDADPQLARLVTDSTDGNPFFVAEMLRHLTETGTLAKLRGASSPDVRAFDPRDLGLPEGVKEVIGRRLSRLSEACNHALRLAAVVGREFDLDVLEVLGEVPVDSLLDTLEEGVRAQLVGEARGRAGRFTFLHALIRETLYGELTTIRRVRLHRRVGEAIEQLARGNPNPPLADLAYHFVQAASAGTADKAIDYAARAGDRAADALAHEEAARFYEMALQSLDFKAAGPDTDVRRNDLHHRRARSFGALGQWAHQKLELERALECLDPQQRERRCEFLLELATPLTGLPNEVRSLERLTTEALALAEQVGRADLAANAIAFAAVHQMLSGRLHDAIATHHRAIARGGDTPIATYTYGPHALYFAGRTPEAAALAVQAVEFFRSSQDTGVLVYALSHVGLTMSAMGRYGEAAKAFDEARQFGRKYGALPQLARATSMSAGFRLSVFDFEGAESTQLEAREIARNAGWHAPVISAGIDLLLIAARRHDPSAVETLLQETTAAAATTPGWHEWLWRLRLCQARAELALARDAFEVSVAEATEAIDQSSAKGRPKYESLGLATKARALHGLGRMRDAIIDARTAVGVARSTADPALLLQTLDVLLALDGSDELAAEAHALSAQIAEALPDETMRRRFTASEAVRRIRRL